MLGGGGGGQDWWVVGVLYCNQDISAMHRVYDYIHYRCLNLKPSGNRVVLSHFSHKYSKNGKIFQFFMSDSLVQ